MHLDGCGTNLGPHVLRDAERRARPRTPAILVSLVFHEGFDIGSSWEFLYMGADQDAVEVGMCLGVKEGQAITYARGKSREVILTVSDNVRAYHNAKLHNPSAAMPKFTGDQRAQLADE
jgi:hypothetical protein